MTELVKTESNLKATQDNQLIEACYTMTLNEKRLLLFGISKINPSTFPDVNKPFKFEMTAKEWTEHFGDDNPWRSLKRAGKKLMGRTLTLHSKTTDSNAPDETMLNWFEEAKFHNNKGRVVITFTRSVQVRLAGMLEQFTQFKSTGYRVMALDDFRFAMDVVNTNKGTKELKRAVLNPAIKQLNEKSDLFCIVQDIKEGRTITGFKFVFRTQEQKQLF